MPVSLQPPSTHWAPSYTTHGHGRKTHVVLTNAEGTHTDTLCGIKGRRPDLLWCCGEIVPMAEAIAWASLDPDGFGCSTCKAKLISAAKAARV